MRCNWRRWLWGVIPLVALGLAAVHIERPAIELDLTGRAQQALKAKGAHWAVVDFSGRDVTLKGSAIAESEPGEAVAALREVWGVGRVKNEAGLPKLVEPYVWSAKRSGSRVRLSGHYPNRAMKQTIIGMTRAAVPGLELVSRMTAARGVPPTDTWLAGVSFALKQLAALKKGDVRLEALALTITGEAENAEAYKLVTAALKRGLPKGITLASVEIAAPVVSPFTWSAEFAGGQLMLSGYVPNEGVRTELLAAARAAATDVVDRMEVAGGAASGTPEAAAALVKAIAKLESGSAEMKDSAVVVGGVAKDDVQAQAVREELRAALPAAFKLTDQIRLREPKVEPKVEAKPDEQPKIELPVAPKAEAKPAEETKAETRAELKADTTGGKPKVETKAAEEPRTAEVAKAEPTTSADPKAQTKTAEEPKAEAKTADAPKAGETKSAEPKASAPGAGQSKETALLAPPPSAPLPAEKAPEPAPTVPEKTGPTAETKAKADAPPQPAPAPPKAETPPAVDVAACRGELVKLSAGNPVLFHRGSSQLERSGRKTLDEIARVLKACPGVRILAEGHTDIEGSGDYNQRLSLKRAQVVKDYLMEAGVAGDAIDTAGLGTSRPVAPNTSRHTRAKNRRTEILVRP